MRTERIAQLINHPPQILSRNWILVAVKSPGVRRGESQMS